MRHRQSGFTIVELVVVISVTGILITVLTGFLLRNLQASSQQTARAALLREVQQSLDEMNADIRLSANADQNNRIADPNAPNNQFGWASGNGTLVLASAATSANGNIIFADAANYVTVKNNIIYYVSNGTLYRRVIAANTTGNTAKTTCPPAAGTATCPADRALMRNITNFNVTYIDGNSNTVSPTSARAVQLQLAATSKQYKLTQAVSYTTRMVFRND